jgi:hypothetical protein
VARIRSVKPELRTSLTVAEWPREVRYLFVLLWGYLDDHGRGVDEPRLVKADCLPLDDDLTSDDVDHWLNVMAASGAVCRYSVGGRKYLHCPNWGEHQKPQHPKDSKIPPCGRSDCGTVYGDLHEDLRKPHESLSDNGSSNTPSPTSVRTEGDGVGDGASKTSSSSSEAETSDAKPGVVREDVERLCTHLADRIEANGSKRPAINKKWRDSARLLMDADGKSEQQVRNMIDWSQSDRFWRGVILSMPKLREKYDQMRLQAEGQPRASPGGQRYSPSSGAHVDPNAKYSDDPKDVFG